MESIKELIKEANANKRKATQADTKRISDMANFSSSVFKEANKDFNSLNFDSSKGITQKYNNYLNEFIDKANAVKANLNFIDIDTEKKNEILKNISEETKALQQIVENARNNERFYKGFESQEHADAWIKTQEYLSKFDSTEDAISDLETKIASKSEEYKAKAKEDNKTAQQKYGGMYARAKAQSVVNTNDLWSSEETKAIKKEIDKMSMFLENLKAQKSRSDKISDVKNKYVLFKGDNKYSETAKKGAELVNPTLKDMQKYEQLEKNAHSGDVFARDELKAMGDVSIKNPVSFFLENKDKYAGAVDTLVPYVYDLSYNWASTMLNGYKNSWAQLSDKEIEMYNYLLAERGRGQADEYLNALEPFLNERQAKEEQKNYAEKYKQLTGWQKAGENIKSVFTNAIDNLQAGTETLAMLATGDYDGNNYYARKVAQNTQLRQLTAEDLTKNIDNPVFHDLVSMGYQGIMSGLDSLAGSVMFGGGGGGSAMYAITAGLGATASKAQELYARGIDQNKIAVGAVASGLLEGLFEKVSLGYFFDNADFSTLGKFFKTALVQGGVEASEEFLTEVSNIAAESLIQGYNSSNWQQINELVMKGYTLEEAQNKVAVQNATDAFWAAYSGFVSGGGMSVSAGVPSYIANRASGNVTTDKKTPKNLSVTRDIYDFASTMPEYTTAYKLSQVASKGGNAYNMVSELAHLKKPLTEAQSEALKTRLTEDGYTPELASKIVDSAVKVSNNISVMSEQKKAIQQNAILTSAILEVVTEADAKTLGISEQFNKRNEETVFAREEVHKKTTENIVKTAEKGGKTITTEEASTKGRNTVKAPKNATVRKISDVVLSRVKNPDLSKNQLKKNEQIVTRIGEALGYKVIIENYATIEKADGTRERVNGYIDKDNKEIHLSRSVDDPIAFIMRHEITHSGENTKAYTDFVKKLRKTNVYREYLASRTGVDGTIDQMEAALGNEIKEVYASKGIELTNEKGKIVAQDAEIVADFVGYLLFNSETKTIENLLNELDKPTRNKFIQLLLDIIDTIKNALKKGDAKLNSEIATLERQLVDMLKDAKTENAKKDNIKGKQFSVSAENKKISVGMTDTERTDILKNKTLTVPIYKGQADALIQQNAEKLNSQKRDLIEKALIKIANDFSVFGKYNVKDFDIEVSVSKSNLSESVVKKATPTQIAKLLPILQESLQNAVGIETHINRYFYDNNTIAFANLLSGYIENNMFIPIRFGIKLSANSAKLYIVIDENPIKKIKVDINDVQFPQKASADTSTSTFNASISRIFENVNNKDLLRYIPDNMLNNEQKQAKQDGIAETIEYINNKNDSKYKEFVKKGDKDSLKRMVQAAAKLAGYTGIYYHGSPDKFTVFDKKKARSSGTWGKGFYFTKSKSHANQYGNSFEVYLNLGNVMKANAETLTNAEIRKLIEAVAGNEDFSIENYGTYDTNKILSTFESKDAFEVLVDLNTTAIGDFAEALKLFNEVLNKNYTSVETDLETVVYSPEQIKSADLITYDENDNVIPISKRFDKTNTDIRYSAGEVGKTFASTVKTTDSDGNKLSDAQREFFKDSKVRDAEGNLLVVYHGTNAEFYTFNKPNKNGWLGKGIYFTVNKGYARKNGRRVIKTYLNLTNPYIATSNDHFGVLAELQNIYPQIDSFNITDVLQENGYDGIIMNDWDKGLIISAFEPNQAKLTTNTNPTSNPDIRYSVESSDVAKFKPIARQLMRNNQIDGDVEDFAKVLKNSFVDVSKDDVGSYEGVMPAVKWLQKNAETTVHLDDYSRDVLSTLRRLNVYLDDVQREEVISAFDSYGDFRKKLMGSITISKKENARESLDTAWQELADTYPEIFDADTNSADMPAALLMAVNDLRSGKFNAEDGSVETDEADLISQVYESYLENIEKFEDKKPVSDYAERVEALQEQLENEEITRAEYKEEINKLFEDAGKTYGTIKRGEAVTGDENFENAVPQSVAKGTKVRRHVRTITEATKDQTLDNILTTAQQKQILSDARTHYVPTSNKENIQKALAEIAKGKGRESWLNIVEGKKSATSVDIAFGELLLKAAIENGDAGRVLQYTAELSEVATRLGRAVQAFSLLKRMGGMGQLYYVQQAVNTLNKDLEERFGKQIEKGKIKKVKIDENLAMRLAESETKEDFAITYEAIMRDIASQVPSTFLDKWNAWRYMAMLANPVTMIRNLVGNAFFAPTVMTKNLLATTFESISKPEERSKTFKVPKEYKEFAKNDWAEVEKIITHGGKYNYSTEIDEYRTIFKSKVLEGIRKGYTGVLEGTDALFLKGYYRQALSGYLAANKADLNNLSKETLAKAREYAMKEAWKATYRDASKLSSILNQISKNKLYGPIVEGVLPFKKTPINILKRGVEYSLIGLVKTLGKGLIGVVTDKKMSATDFFDGLASGTTGTGLFVIGMFLKAAGLVTIGIDDEDEWWRKLNGEQDFAITVWGKSYTIDWMAPACMPVFMGAAVYDAFTQETNENPFNAVFNAGMGALDVIVDMSMLQGISNLLDSIKFTKSADGGVFQLATNAIMSYANQGLPTVVGKITNTIDDTRRTTYIDKTKGMEDVQSAYDNILKKFAPWERQAYVNAWGEEEKTGPVWQRILQNFVSPGYYSEIEANKVTEEISRLYKETKDKKILPEIPDKKVSFKGITKNLTGEEYYIYATTRGQKNADYLAEMVENEKFLQLTTEQQTKVIKNLYEFSDAYSKSLLDYTYADIVAMDVVNVTEEEYNKLSKETKTALAKAFFLKSYGDETKLERNGGSVVDYYIDQEIKASKTPQKEKKKQSVSEAIKNFS